MCGYAGWYTKKFYRELLFFIPFQQLFLIGPVIYFYTRTLLNPSFTFSRKDWIHWIPAILYLLYSLVIFVVDKMVLEEYYFYADGRDKNLAPWYQVAGLVSMFLYLIMSLRYYYRYKKLTVHMVSYADSVQYKWMQHFFIVFIIILLLRVLFFILNPEWGEFGSKFWYYLCFSFLFYYIAINGYSNTIRHTIDVDSTMLEDENLEGTTSKNNIIESQELDTWKSRLTQLILKEKLYENPRLTLSDVAEQLETYPKMISQMVNQGFGMNFNEFVNFHRVEAVKQRLQLGEQTSKTLLSIALDSGFNSKATFNRAFKKHTSLSPKEYLIKIS